MTALTFSVEVITIPVSDVDRALRFYKDQLGFHLDVDYSPNHAFRVVQLTPSGSACSIQIGNGLTDARVGSLRNVYLVVTDLDATRTQLLSAAPRSARSATRRPSTLGTEVSRPDSIPRAATMPASPASPIRMAIAGSCRNAATATRDIVSVSCEPRFTSDFHASWLSFYQ